MTQIEPSIKKGPVRGMAQRSVDLIEAMAAIAKAAQPITGRGVGYKLLTAGLIPSMSTNEMQKVYRLLRLAREQGDINWSWIVDENRPLEKTPSWADPAEFLHCVKTQYRRDFWQQQPERVEVWSEKGTVRGVLQPVLDEYAVGFRVMHGFGSATIINNVSQDDDGRPLTILYIGDWDPSGLWMSDHDLPGRLSRYGGDHVTLKRIALTNDSVLGLPSFPADDKKKDPRYAWFTKRYGTECWELDAMDPRDLRACVNNEIVALIEPDAWERCDGVDRVEQESMRAFLASWRKPGPTPA
jgi:hypothetical protein